MAVPEQIPARTRTRAYRRASTDQVRQYIGKVKLVKTGGSLMMTIPASARKALSLSEGAEMNVAVEDGRIFVEPVRHERPHYTLDELLAQCDPQKPYSEETKAWANAEPMGREIW